ncbi:MAG: Holliday junction branch migration protein RuvA [Clostridiales bacterium]|nr:Holliday junction branch migration protein RuvA [Clostridiales bacterium]
MIAYLKGKLLQKSENLIIIEVSNVGYEVNISTNTYLNIVNKEETEIFTYLQVREDGISLFGFSTINEKELFLKLITVNGVGPKMAISILSGASLTDLVTSIVAEDTLMLSRVKGVGKKTAERIILELKEKVGNELLVQSSTVNENIDLSSSIVNDALMALVTLGLTKTDAMKKIKQEYDVNDTVETLIEKVLKNLSR